MVNRLRELAGKIDKATPGPWEVGECHESKAEVNANGKEICRVHVMRTWSGEEKQPDSEDTAEAICLARNEAPDLLREAADEIERLRRVIINLHREEVLSEGQTSRVLDLPRDEVRIMRDQCADLAQELQKETQ